MAIIICENCGGKVSSTRKTCPHCGVSISETKICPECEEVVDASLLECPTCGYVFENEVSKIKPVPIKEEKLTKQKTSNDIRPAYEGGIRGIAILERKINKEKFLRHALKELCKKEDIPVDIFNATFKEVKETTVDAYVVKGLVQGPYTATVGYDRKEKYIVKDMGYVARNVPYTVDGHPRIGTGERVWHDVEKERTVTDWSPFQGVYGPKESSATLFGSGEPLHSILYTYLLRNKEFELSENNEGLCFDQGDIANAKASLVYNGEIDTRVCLPGDHYKDLNCFYTADLTDIYVVRFPAYEIKIIYKDKEYLVKGVADKTFDIYVDTIEKGEEETVETINSQKISEMVEKDKPFEIAKKVSLISSIVTGIAGAVGLSALTYAMTLFYTMGIIGLSLCAISIVLTIIFHKTIDRIDDKISKKYEKIVQLFNFRKIAALETALEAYKLPSLTDEEKESIQPGYKDINKEDLKQESLPQTSNSGSKVQENSKEKRKLSKQGILTIILSCFLFLFLLAPFIMYFTAPFIVTQNIHIPNEYVNHDYLRGMHLLSANVAGYYSLPSLIMLISNGVALILSILIPLLKLKNKLKPVILVIQSVLIFIATVSLILIPMTTFYKGDYLSPSCFELYVTYILPVIFLPISLIICLVILFICTYTKDKKKPFKVSTYITSASIILLSGLVALSACLILPRIDSSQYMYRTINNNTEVEILGLKDEKSSDIHIPEEINGLPVTSIGERAFLWCSNIQSITLPSTLRNIGDSAFSSCTSLRDIVIPSSVTYISDLAFSSCQSIKTIYIPESVIYLGHEVFNNCSRDLIILCESDYIPTSWDKEWNRSEYSYYTGVDTYKNNKYRTADCSYFRINDYAVLTDYNSNDEYPNIVSHLRIDGSEYPVKIIGHRVFQYKDFIKSIVIPDTVTTIGNFAFDNCESLEDVRNSNNLTSIGKDAFRECKKINNITLPNTLTSIGESAFTDCEKLDWVIIPKNVTYIGDYAFNNCRNLMIFCEADSKPSGWSSDWNCDDRPVYWAGEWTNEYGYPDPISN